MNESHTSSVNEATKNLPHYFALLIALAFGTGFLCVFTFFDRFGIRETGEDFFRVKYIHVGILFMLLPLSILAPLALAFSLKRTELKENEIRARERKLKQSGESDPLQDENEKKSNENQSRNKFHIPIPSIVIFFNMLWVFYVFVLFTPRDFAFGKAAMFPLIFLSSLVGPFLIDWFVNNYIVPHKSEVFAAFLRWGLVGIIIGGMDYWIFYGFFSDLWIIFWGKHWYPDGGIYYLLFMLLIVFTIWRTNERAKYAPNKRSKRELYLAAAAAVLMLYFLGIIAFALRVYPLIPVAKGGGNYNESPVVMIQFRPVVKGAIEETNSITEALSKSNSFVVIEQSPSSLFLADINDQGGPTKWQEMRKMPGIVEVERETIDRIIYTQRSITNF